MKQATTPRKVIYYVAMSVDHYIAHADESIDGFVMEGHHISDYLDSLRDYDAVLMGRRTYEWGYQFDVQPGAPVHAYAHMQQYVFSKTLSPSSYEQLTVVDDDPAQFVSALKQQSGGSIYLCGGGALAESLLEAGQVDELILKVNPVVFGTGIAVFGGLKRQLSLRLLDTKMYNNGVLFIHYAIEHI